MFSCLHSTSGYSLKLALQKEVGEAKLHKYIGQIERLAEIVLPWNKIRYRIICNSTQKKISRGSLSAIFNIDLDLDPNPRFASMELMLMNIGIFSISNLILTLTLSFIEVNIR